MSLTYFKLVFLEYEYGVQVKEHILKYIRHQLTSESKMS